MASPNQHHRNRMRYGLHLVNSILSPRVFGGILRRQRPQHGGCNAKRMSLAAVVVHVMKARCISSTS
jgi:hypothetical protein